MNLVFAVSNYGIALGYLFVMAVILPHFQVQRRWVRWAVMLFFFTCGLTHLDMAIYSTLGMHHPVTLYSTINHVVQAGAVATFVVGLYLEFVVGNRAN